MDTYKVLHTFAPPPDLWGTLPAGQSDEGITYHCRVIYLAMVEYPGRPGYGGGRGVLAFDCEGDSVSIDEGMGFTGTCSLAYDGALFCSGHEKAQS